MEVTARTRSSPPHQFSPEAFSGQEKARFDASRDWLVCSSLTVPQAVVINDLSYLLSSIRLGFGSMNGQIEGGAINNAVTSRLTGINFSSTGIAWTRRNSALRRKDGEDQTTQRDERPAAMRIECDHIRPYLARCWRQKLERLFPSYLGDVLGKDVLNDLSMDTHDGSAASDGLGVSSAMRKKPPNLRDDDDHDVRTTLILA